MTEFKDNWNFSEKYMPQVCEVLRANAIYLIDIRVASEQDDVHHSTDLNVNVTGGNVAVRIRRNNKTFRDLTIRAYKGGHKTEIDKLREGFADWYLYAWEGINNTFDDWILVDINILRKSGMLNQNRYITMNTDGDSGFVTYSIPELVSCGALTARKENALASRPSATEY